MPGIYPNLVYFIINPSNRPNGDLITIEFTWYANGPIIRPLFFNQDSVNLILVDIIDTYLTCVHMIL